MPTTPAHFDSRIIEPRVNAEKTASVVSTQAQRDAAADRIAAFLIERKKIAEQERKRECEYRLRNSERARLRYHMMVRRKSGTDILSQATLATI